MADDRQQLAELLAEIAKHESEAELSRNSLYQKDDFSPTVTFRLITNSQSIAPHSVKEFLESQDAQVTDRDIELLFEVNDRNGDGVLGLGEFLYAFASRAFSLEAQIKPEETTTEANENRTTQIADLVKAILQEIRTSWEVCCLLRDSGHLNSAETLENLRSLLSSHSPEGLAEKDVRSIFGSAKISNPSKQAELVLARLDLDGDGKISPTDWNKWQHILQKFASDIPKSNQIAAPPVEAQDLQSLENPKGEPKAIYGVDDSHDAHAIDTPKESDPDVDIKPPAKVEEQKYDLKPEDDGDSQEKPGEPKAECEQFTEFPIERMSGEEVRLTNDAPKNPQREPETPLDIVPDSFVSDPNLRIRDIQEKQGETSSPRSSHDRPKRDRPILQNSELFESVHITADFATKRASDKKAQASRTQILLRNQVGDGLSKLFKLLKTRERERIELANKYSVCLTQIFEVLVGSLDSATCDFGTFKKLAQKARLIFDDRDLRTIFTFYDKSNQRGLKSTEFFEVFLPRQLTHKQRALNKAGDYRVRRFEDLEPETFEALRNCLDIELKLFSFLGYELSDIQGRLHELFDLRDAEGKLRMTKLQKRDIQTLLQEHRQAPTPEELDEILSFLQYQQHQYTSPNNLRDSRPFLRASYQPSQIFSRKSVERLSGLQSSTHYSSNALKRGTAETYTSDTARFERTYRSPVAHRLRESIGLSSRSGWGNQTYYRETTCLGGDSSCVWRQSYSNPLQYLPTTRYQEYTSPARTSGYSQVPARDSSERRQRVYDRYYGNLDCYGSTKVQQVSSGIGSGRESYTYTKHSGDSLIQITKTVYPACRSVYYY